jgi:hypothetical protein
MLLIFSSLTVVTTMAQNLTVFAGETTALSVAQAGGDTYTWELYTDLTGLNLAVESGNCPANDAFFVGGVNTGAEVNVTWVNPGIYFFKVTAVSTCPTNNLKIGMVEVLEAKPLAILALQPEEICKGETANLMITFQGKGPWSFRLMIENQEGTTYVDYSGVDPPDKQLTIPVSPDATTAYTVVDLSDSIDIQPDPSNTVTLKVNPLPRSSRIYVKTNTPGND